MLYKYFTEKLLGLQDILIENIEEIDGTIHIYANLNEKCTNVLPVEITPIKFTIIENR